MKKTLINYLGLLGLVSLISYTLAVVLTPRYFPGYDWMSQAVSDLSATTAPSKPMWDRFTALYGTCGVVSITAVCLFIKDKLTKLLRIGIYIFAVMNWISDVGYKMFPLSESGLADEFQDTMHLVVTAAVVPLSIVSLTIIIIGGFKGKTFPALAVFAAIALGVMFVGSIGTGAAPKSIFGIFERFSVFAATGFNAVLGIYLFTGFKTKSE